MAENRESEGRSAPPEAGTEQAEIAALVQETIDDLIEKTPQKVATIYIIVVVVLGSTVLATVIGAIWLTLAGETVPDLLISLGSAAIGALAGLLAPSSG
jgi:hypothetical protein